jgi:hypothetical protein
MVSRAIVGTEDVNVPQKVLTHNENMADKGMTFYASALDKVVEQEDKADNKTILKLANLVDDELARKSNAGERSNIAMIGNTAVRIMEQPAIRAKVEEGFHYGMNALSIALTALGIGVPAGGAALLKGRKRIANEVLKNRIKTKVLSESPELLAKVNEAAVNSPVEGKIT